MADKEIRRKIVLDGEKEFSRAIQEAQRNLKTLKSELKAETAELGRNATQQEKNEVKTASLKKQIAEQERIVKTYTKALAEVREKYADNEGEIARWEQKLNGARTELANMKNALEGVGTGFQRVDKDAAMATVATKSVADALGSIGSAGESVADAIENIFTGLIDKVTAAMEQLWALISETAAKANNWTDLASYYNSSAQEIQMWDRAITAAGGDFNKFIDTVNRLAFGGKEKKITELIGISKGNYEDDIEYTLAVLDELEKRRAQLGQGWYDSAMTEIFGAKKSQSVSWLLGNAHSEKGTGWRDNPERYSGQGSYGLSEDELGTMNELYIKIKEIETKWDDLKSQFAAGFGGVSLDLLVNVEGTLDGIADYLNATDEAGKQAALDKIRANVEEFFTKLADIIRESIGILRGVGESLQGSDDPLTSAIGDILVRLSEGLQWMVDHADEVKAAFETIFGAWLVAQLASVAGKLSSILMQIEMIKGFKGIGGGGSGGTGDVTGGGAGGGGLLAAAGNGLNRVLPGIAGWLQLNGMPVADWLTHESPIAGVLNGQESVTEFAARTRGQVKKNASTFASDWAHLGDASYGKSTELNEHGLTEDQEHNLRLYYQLYSQWQRTGSLPDYAKDEYNRSAQRLPELFAGQEDLLRYYLLRMQGYGGDGLLGEDFFSLDGYAGETSETGERVADALDAVVEKLEEREEAGAKEPALPEDWWRTTGAWSGSDWWRTTGAWSGSESPVTSSDLEGLKGLPAGMLAAVRKGAAAGVAGIRIDLDGWSVGRAVAPYVSEMIAESITE